MKISKQQFARWWALALSATLLGGCAGWLPATGPSYSNIGSSNGADTSLNKQVNIIDVSDSVISQLSNITTDALSEGVPQSWRMGKPALLLGAGDGVQVSIFEAPPAVLLSAAASMNSADLSIGSGSGVMNLPEQMVSQSGTIVVPFAGEVPVAGKTLSQVEQMIRARLSKIANQPQVVARLSQNASNSVVVLSDGRSLRMSLTAKGERLLDVLPLAGDAKKIKSTSIRLTRRGETRFISANDLSRDAGANIYLQTGDVIAVLQDPYRITVLGATNANAAVDFGDDGLTVAEAIGRVSGLNDYRADPRGVFVFRRAERATADVNDPERTLPTVYRIDVRDTQGMMLAQNFHLRDKDMLYVSNAPSVQLQKVLNMFNSTINSAASTVTSVNTIK